MAAVDVNMVSNKKDEGEKVSRAAYINAKSLKKGILSERVHLYSVASLISTSHLSRATVYSEGESPI